MDADIEYARHICRIVKEARRIITGTPAIGAFPFPLVVVAADTVPAPQLTAIGSETAPGAIDAGIINRSARRQPYR